LQDCLYQQVHEALLAREIEEQEEVLAEPFSEEIHEEQERIFAEECTKEGLRDRLHQQAHDDLLAQEMAEQEEVLAEPFRQEIHEEQERIFAEESAMEDLQDYFRQQDALIAKEIAEQERRAAIMGMLHYATNSSFRNGIGTRVGTVYGGNARVGSGLDNDRVRAITRQLPAPVLFESPLCRRGALAVGTARGRRRRRQRGHRSRRR